MKVIGVIPARFESTRLPHKLLKDLCGKPLLQWSYEAAKKARLLDTLIIACDDKRIKDAAAAFNAPCVMTSLDHKSGTDRIIEAVSTIDAKVVINIQADEPLINPLVIDHLAQEMLSDDKLMMATAKCKIANREEVNNPNVVKVVCDKNGYALYFSRHAIPYLRDKDFAPNYYKHLGIYAYTKDFLYVFKKLSGSMLETAEKLEQLRALESGYRIKVIEVDCESIGVDTQEDFNRVEAIIKKKAIKV